MKDEDKVFYDDGLRVIKSTINKKTYSNFRIVKSEDAYESVSNLEKEEKNQQYGLKFEITALKDLPPATIFIRLPFEKDQFYDPLFAEFGPYVGKIPTKEDEATRFVFARDEDAPQLRRILKDTNIIVVPLYDMVLISPIAMFILQKLEIDGVYYCIFTYVGVYFVEEKKSDSSSLN